MGWRKIPDHFYPPEIMPGCEDWYAAFWELSTDRQMTGFGAGPIPAASIERHMANMDSDDQIAFHMIIRRMDAAFLQYLAREARKNGRRSPSN